MIETISGFNAANYPRPSDEVDPAYKDTNEWNLLWNQFMYGQYCINATGVKSDEQEQVRINREYAAGRQSTAKYKAQMNPEQLGPRYLGDTQFDSVMNHGETMMSINFDQIFSPIPKIMLAIQAIMEETEHGIRVQATNEKSNSMKSMLKWQAYVDGINKPFFDYVKSSQGVNTQESPVLPSGFEELEIMQKIGSFKLAYEIAMKDAINLTLRISKYKKIKRRVVYDLVCAGKAATICYNELGGVTKTKYIDFSDLIIEDSDDEGNVDASYGSMLTWMNACDIRSQCDISEAELEKIARRWKKGKKGVLYGIERRDGAVWYDNVKIPVFHSFYKSVNKEYKTYHKDGRIYNEPWKTDKDPMGRTTYTPPKVYDTEFRKTEVHNSRVMYTSKWILDSKFVFDCHMVTDLPYDYYAKDVKLPFILYKIPGKPIVESMIPIADDIQLTYLKLQLDRATAPPDGLKIEVSSITNIKIGKKTLHPLDVLKIYTHTGRLLYRIAPLEGGNHIGSQDPVAKIEGGYNNAVMSAAAALNLAYGELNRISGISDIAVGANPGSEQGLGVSKIALATTSQTLKPIYTGWVTIKEGLAEYSALKIHSSISGADGIESPYYEMLGPAGYNAIKGAGSYPPIYWGFTMVAGIDTGIRQQIFDAAKAGLAVGKDGVPILTMGQYLYIVSKLQEDDCNVDDLRAYITFKETKATEKAAERARQNQQITGQIQANNDKAKADAELASQTALSNLKIREDRELTKNKALLIVVEYDLKQKLALNQIRTQADVDNGQLPGDTPSGGTPIPGTGQPQDIPAPMMQ